MLANALMTLLWILDQSIALIMFAILLILINVNFAWQRRWACFDKKYRAGGILGVNNQLGRMLWVEYY